MEGQEIRGLMEAYSQVYETPEVLNEEIVEEDIEVLDEAPMTAFQAAGGQAKLDQLNKNRSPRSGRVTAAQLERRGQENLYKAGGGDAAIAKGPTRNQNVRGGRSVKVPTLTRQDIINRGTVAAAKPAKPGTPPTPAKPGTTPAAAKPTTPAAPAKPTTPAAPAKPGTPAAPAAPAKPGTPAAAKPTTPAAPAKPTTPAAPAKSAGSAMDQWAKANPRLAQAQKIRQQGGSRAEVNKVLYNKGTAAADSTPTVVKAGVDLFDLVKGHLLDEGYADTEEGAMVIMVNMSEEWRKSILESHGVEIYDEELELGEGMSMKDFKANRKKNERKEASADARSRGHEEPSTGKTYSADEARSRRSGIHNPEKKPSRDAARDAAGGETGHGGPLRANKVRKAKAMGEISESQRARENPEDHDKEEKRKYEPVRGERTPMPPRGDKRREDFEKWYAKHVR